MAEPREGASAREAAPASVDEALARARTHGRAAAAEAALAARALLDALSLATSGASSEQSRALAWIAAALDDAARGLGRDEPGTGSLLGAVADALDAEITRWEARAGVDRDARAVLRAYLGLREILWELGLRAPSPADARPAPARPKPARAGSLAPESEPCPRSRARPRRWMTQTGIAVLASAPCPC